MSGRRIIIVAGPTAVGKSALALKLCEQLPGELISVDSVQVYRGLTIGANKPSASERRAVAHHLLDLREPRAEYTAGEFYRDALRSIGDVLSRGRTPVLCGGTSMYLRWLVRGRPDAPKADPALAEEVRAALAPLERAADWDGGLARLERLDARRASALSRNDWYRLHRALVVAEQTRRGGGEEEAGDDVGALDAFRASLDMRCFFVAAPREPLCRRIDARCEEMLQAGLLEEVRSQLEELKLLPSCPAGRAIGYRQTMEYLLRTPWERRDGDALREYVLSFAAASRRYAAQQTKWFRSEPAFEWLPAEWEQPARLVATVAAHAALERGEFDELLRSPEQEGRRRARLRAIKPDEGKAMRLYVPQLHCLNGSPSEFDALLERADACRERLEEMLPDIQRADSEMAKRFPWKHQHTTGVAELRANDEPAEDSQRSSS